MDYSNDNPLNGQHSHEFYSLMRQAAVPDGIAHGIAKILYQSGFSFFRFSAERTDGLSQCRPDGLVATLNSRADELMRSNEVLEVANRMALERWAYHCRDEPMPSFPISDPDRAR